jgi:hypothetical protein
MTAAHPPASRRGRTLGLTLCQLAVPALAIPSAIGVATFFQVADGTAHWSLQGVIAATGFELMNVGLSVLDIRHPELHPTVHRVRFWSVTTAIALNVIAHYGERVPGLDRIDLVGGLLALVASVPLAVLYVALAGLLHAIGERDHAEADDRASLLAELATAREALAAQARDLARVSAALATAREAHAGELAGLRAQAREGADGLATQIAGLQATLAAEREQQHRANAEAREAEARAREELAAARAAHRAELAEGRALAARVERERERLAQAVEGLRQELAARADRSRDALIREAQALQAERGWGASEIGRQLGWPESTVRGWLPTTRAASAAD